MFSIIFSGLLCCLWYCSMLFRLSPRHLIEYSPINRNQLSVNIHVLAQENHRLCHLLIAAWPIGGHIMAFVLHLFRRHVGLITVIALCCISLGQYYPFGGSTGAPRHCLGASDLLEQRENRLGRSNFSWSSRWGSNLELCC